MERLTKEYESPFITWLGTGCFLYVNDPETMETIFNSTCCTNKGDVYRFMSSAIGDGLFTSSCKLICPSVTDRRAGWSQLNAWVCHLTLKFNCNSLFDCWNEQLRVGISTDVFWIQPSVTGPLEPFCPSSMAKPIYLSISWRWLRVNRLRFMDCWRKASWRYPAVSMPTTSTERLHPLPLLVALPVQLQCQETKANNWTGILIAFMLLSICSSFLLTHSLYIHTIFVLFDSFKKPFVTSSRVISLFLLFSFHFGIVILCPASFDLRTVSTSCVCPVWVETTMGKKMNFHNDSSATIFDSYNG